MWSEQHKFYIVLSMGPGLDLKQISVRLQNSTQIRPGGSWQPRAVPIPVKPPGLLSWAQPICSNHQFLFWGFPIFGRSQICYRYLQNLHFGTSFSLFVSLAAFIIKTRRDMLPATS
jgi:hypothetical protein